MIVDTSALLAILLDEADAEDFAQALGYADTASVSAGTLLEAGIVVDARGDAIGRRRFDDLLAGARMRVEPVTAEHVEIGRAAYRDFGKGSGHPAQLNFGDCFAYALARATGEPLLFKGNDFSHTDLQPAL